ncbi:hypothetical protein JW968_03675 [Candidatus Woesearchaeota archaeon]|nr:hypothetical protein [Candidatus Woesearchaeota archaeon]
MVISQARCKHCKKEMTGKTKLIGLASICPFCEKPSEEISLKRGEGN